MLILFFFVQIINSIESAPEILVQVQEIVIPIIMFTLEHKLLGEGPTSANQPVLIPFLVDLFDTIYDLVDSLTFKIKAISPNMWPIFETTYKLFKTDAVDFLEGQHRSSTDALTDIAVSSRNATLT